MVALVPEDMDRAEVVDEVDCAFVASAQVRVVVIRVDQPNPIAFVYLNGCVHTLSLQVMRLNDNPGNR